MNCKDKIEALMESEQSAIANLEDENKRMIPMSRIRKAINDSAINAKKNSIKKLEVVLKTL